VKEYSRSGLTFDVRDEGDGEAVVFLHGYPETKEMWAAVIPPVVAAGYRALAPDQRGYSPRARPRGRWAYRQAELIADVVALLDAASVDRAHVVGHDWGGAIAWELAMQHPDRVRTLTVFSTPHPRAFVRAMFTSRQWLHSWYMFFYQLPLLPDLSTSGPNRRLFRRTLVRSGLPEAVADRYIERFGTRATLAPINNWYRGVLVSRIGSAKVSVPTTYVYSDADFAILRKGADLTRQYVTGAYRYEILEGVSHWIAEERPDDVARFVLEQVSAGQ
jgi:pimeloyl-ACP methyl ester carboxylesterase